MHEALGRTKIWILKYSQPECLHWKITVGLDSCRHRVMPLLIGLTLKSALFSPKNWLPGETKFSSIFNQSRHTQIAVNITDSGFCIIRPQYGNLEVKDLGIFLMQLLVVEASHSDGDSSQTQQGWALQDTEASGSIAFGRETHDNPSEPQSPVSTGEGYKQPTGRGLWGAGGTWSPWFLNRWREDSRILWRSWT